MASKKYSFKKEERLCSKKLLTALFHNGSSFLLYPYRITWMPSSKEEQAFPVQVVIGVPKKRFKLSVDRNLIKRKIKEAYRLNKNTKLYPFLSGAGKPILLSLNYVGKEFHEYDYLQKKMIQMINELIKKVGE